MSVGKHRYSKQTVAADRSDLRGMSRFASLLVPAPAGSTPVAVDTMPVVIPGSANVGVAVRVRPPPNVSLVLSVPLSVVKVALLLIPPDQGVAVFMVEVVVVVVVLDPAAAVA